MKMNPARAPLLTAAFLASFALSLFGQAADADVRQAVRLAMRDAAASMKASRIPAGTPVSCLPLMNDADAVVEGQAKIAVGDAGRQYVEGKTDPFWDAVLEEVAWDTRKADMLDPATLAAFGKLKATKILIYGVVRAAEKTGRRVYVEIELHASSIETKEHLWGGTFIARYYEPGEDAPEGISEIPAEIREPMRRMLTEQTVASIRDQKKLQAVRSVALVPLAGDIDRYATFVIRDAVSKTALISKDIDISTLGEARRIISDNLEQADALLYGALRDLSRKVVGRTVRSTTYEVRAEVQACIENVATREQLWSDSIFAKDTYTETITWWQWVIEVALPWLQDHPRAWQIALGVIIILIILNKLIRAGTRVR